MGFQLLPQAPVLMPQGFSSHGDCSGKHVPKSWWVNIPVPRLPELPRNLFRNPPGIDCLPFPVLLSQALLGSPLKSSTCTQMKTVYTPVPLILMSLKKALREHFPSGKGNCDKLNDGPQRGPDPNSWNLSMLPYMQV